MVSDDDVVGPAQCRRVGGPSEPKYFLMVDLWILNSRSVALSDIPLRLAFQSPSIAPSAGMSACAWGLCSYRPCPRCPLELSLPLPWSPGVGESRSSVRPSRGSRKVGQERVWNALGRFGGYGTRGRPLAARPRPSYRTVSRPSSPSKTSTAAPAMLGRSGCGSNWRVCNWNLTVLSLATLLQCLQHRICPRHNSGSRGRNAGLGYDGEHRSAG